MTGWSLLLAWLFQVRLVVSSRPASSDESQYLRPSEDEGLEETDSLLDIAMQAGNDSDIDSSVERGVGSRERNSSTVSFDEVENQVRRMIHEDDMLLAFADVLLGQKPSYSASHLAKGHKLMVPLGSDGCCASLDHNVVAKNIQQDVTQHVCKDLCVRNSGCRAAQITGKNLSEDDGSELQRERTSCTLFLGNGSVGRASSCELHAHCFLKVEKATLYFGSAHKMNLARAVTRELLLGQHSDPGSSLGNETSPSKSTSPGQTAPPQEKFSASDFADKVATRTWQDFKDTFNIARGAKTAPSANEELDSYFTPSTLQRIKEDDSGDVKKIVIYLGINVLIVCMTVLFVCCFKSKLEAVYFPRRAGHSILSLSLPWTLENKESEEMVLAAAGLDGLMLMKFLRIGVFISSVTCLVNVLILCPGHLVMSPSEIFTADCSQAQAIFREAWLTDSQCRLASHQLRGTHEVFFDTSGRCMAIPWQKAEAEVQKVCVLEKLGAAQRLSMKALLQSGVNHDGILWLDTASVVIVTCTSVYALCNMMKQFRWRRKHYMLSTPARATVFVHGVPEDFAGSGFRAFFEGLFPGRILDAYQVPTPQNLLQQAVRLVKRRRDDVQEFAPCGFVTFKSERDAHQCDQVRLSTFEEEWQTEMAPEPSEILWNELSSYGSSRMHMKQVFSQLLFWLLFICWFPPVAFISVLANLDNLQGVPILGSLVDWIRRELPDVFESLDAKLSALVMACFMSFLPLLLNSINMSSGAWAHRMVNKDVERQYFKFLFFYGIILNAVSLSTFKFLQDVLLHPSEALLRMAQGLSLVSCWFMTYLIFTIAGLAAELLRPYQLGIWLVWNMGLIELSDGYMEEPDESTGTTATRMCFYLSIAILYSTMSPIILPISCLVFLLASLVYRYKLLCVWRSSYDSGGLFVCTAARNLHGALFVYQLTMLGVLQLGAHAVDTFWHSVVIVACILVNYTYFRRHADEVSYMSLPLDTPLLESQEKSLGSYRPPG